MIKEIITAGALIAVNFAAAADLTELVDRSFARTSIVVSESGLGIKSTYSKSQEFSLELDGKTLDLFAEPFAGAVVPSLDMQLGFGLYDYEWHEAYDSLMYVRYGFNFSNSLTWQHCDFELGGLFRHSELASRYYLGAKIIEPSQIPLPVLGNQYINPETSYMGASLIRQDETGYTELGLELRSVEHFSFILKIARELGRFGLRVELPINNGAFRFEAYFIQQKN